MLTRARSMLHDIRNGQVFRVLSSTLREAGVEYRNELLVCVYDEDLPEKMRRGDQTSALFLIIAVHPRRGEATEVVLQEIDFDIDDGAEVELASPFESLPNGSIVQLTDRPKHPEDFRSLRIGRMTPDGRLRPRF